MTAGFIVAVVFGYMCSTEDDTHSMRHSELELGVIHDLAKSNIEKPSQPRYLHAG